MLNSDIFNFEFVDRKSERDSVDNFLEEQFNSFKYLFKTSLNFISYHFLR